MKNRLNLFFNVAFIFLIFSSSQSFAGWQVYWGSTERTPAGFCGETMAEACTSVVNTGQGGWSYSWSGGGCQSQYTGNPPNSPITSGFSQCDTTCAAGQERYQGMCVAACVGDEVRNPQSGLCEAPCKLHPNTLECVSNCAGLKGGTFGSTNAGLTGGTRQGCAISCSLAVGGPWAVQCTYLGTEPEPGGPNGEGEESGGEQESAGGEPPEGSEEAPQDEEGEPEECPPGTKPGFVNGQRYCAPDSGSGPAPPTEPTENDPTGLGPKVDSLRSSIEATRAAVEATGNAVNRQTSLLESGLGKVVGAINAQGPNVGGDGGGGEGGGDPDGDCDPTSSDYFQCAGLIEEISDTQQQDILDAGNSSADLLIDDHETAATDLRDDIVNEPIEGPSGLESFVNAVLPQPTSCVQMTLNFPGHPLSLPCERFDFLKQIIGWALAIFTTFLIWGIATRPAGA